MIINRPLALVSHLLRRHCAVILLLLVFSLSSVAFVHAAPLHPVLPVRLQQPTDDPSHNPADLRLQAQAAYDAQYRAGSWVPIAVTLHNDGIDRTVDVQLQILGNPTQFVHGLDLPRGAQKSVTLYAFLPGIERRLDVHVVDAHDVSQLLVQQELRLTPHSSETHMIGVLADHPATLVFPVALASGQDVVRVDLKSDALPDHPAALSTFNTLVLDGVNTAAWSDAQLAALNDWVIQGGRLILTGGHTAEQTLNGLPENLRIAQFDGVQQIDLGALFGFPGANLGLSTMTLVTPLDAAPVPYARQSNTFSTAGMVQPADAPLLLERQLGNGFITFIALPLRAVATNQWPAYQRFWSELLTTPDIIPPGFAPPGVSQQDLINGNLAVALTNLPELEIPSFWLLGSLLLVYIVLVGPLTYLVLRWFDRLAWGWLVVPVITLVFAILAYSLGFAQRGGDMIVHQITVLEPVATERPDRANERSFGGIFSPATQAYQLTMHRNGETMHAAPLLRPISVQGPWDTSSLELGGRFYQTSDPQTTVTDFEINQWSMRALTAQQVVPFDGVQAQVYFDGQQLRAEVINTGDTMLHDVCIVQGTTVLDLGDLAPGARAESSVTMDALGMVPSITMVGTSDQQLSYLIFGDDLPSGNWSAPTPSHALLLRMAIIDAIWPYGTSRSPAPQLFAWRESASLTVDIPHQRVDQEGITLITFAPPLTMTTDTLRLGQGWLIRSFDLPPEQLSSLICMSSQGLSVSMNGQPVEQTLALPPRWSGLLPSQIRFFVVGDGEWPLESSIDLYDWHRGEWERHTLDNRRLTITQPERFLNGSQTMRVRFGVEEQISGCFAVDAALIGHMQP
ncbi:MAG: hypothetical protein HC837_06605 [Chloroflexaceae bacterium]|nr:hypothetical protein [Chloroflexaceae bacterium]